MHNKDQRGREGGREGERSRVGCLTIFTPSKTHGSELRRPSVPSLPAAPRCRPARQPQAEFLPEVSGFKELRRSCQAFEFLAGLLGSTGFLASGCWVKRRGRPWTASVGLSAQQHPDARPPQCPSDPDKTVKRRPESDRPEQKPPSRHSIPPVWQSSPRGSDWIQRITLAHPNNSQQLRR